jgi:hypothetical protein
MTAPARQLRYSAMAVLLLFCLTFHTSLISTSGLTFIGSSLSMRRTTPIMQSGQKARSSGLFFSSTTTRNPSINSLVCFHTHSQKRSTGGVRLRRGIILATLMAMVLCVPWTGLIKHEGLAVASTLAYPATLEIAKTSITHTASVSLTPSPSTMQRIACTLFPPEQLEMAAQLCYATLLGSMLGMAHTQSSKAHPIKSARQHKGGRSNVCHISSRTFSLVALGAAIFTICGRSGFARIPLADLALKEAIKVDISRMASNAVTGVGFIGAGVITTHKADDGSFDVRGLTTAASIWVSAAVGIASGCKLYFAGLVAAGLTALVIRMGECYRKLFSKKSMRSTFSFSHSWLLFVLHR